MTGEGPETIITTHGLTECGAYWSRPGVSAALADAGYRVVDMDMRGHGRSVPEPGTDPGYTADAVADDLGALADHLGVERFHLLTHATGGMAGLRCAMSRHERLLTLISTDTGSATAPSDTYSDPDYEGPYPELLAPPIDNLPNLVLLGELDEMFIRPSELLAKHLPMVEHVVVPGRGHMLAIEDPEGTTATIVEFLHSR